MGIADRVNIETLIYSNDNILGMVEFRLKNFGISLLLLEKAYRIMMKVNPGDEPLLLVNLARVNFRLGRTGVAEEMGLRAFDLSKKNRTIQYVIITAQFLDQFYLKTNRSALAYKYLKEGYENLIEFRVQAFELQINEMKAKLRVAETEKENEDRLEKTAANLETSNITLQKFISIIAHDLKNPINTIMGFTEILIGDKDGMNREEQQKALEFTNKAAFGAFRLLEQLLEWARIQAGIIKADPQPLSLADLYAEAIAVVYPSAILKNQQIVNTMAGNIFVVADQNMMQTLFRNVFSNAVKFTPSGGKITIAADRESDQIIISVTDTGIGIPDDQIEHLFRIDMQYKTKGTAGETGTGLGLLLCKEYAEKNKGSINVHSTYGKGTTVIITLPAG